MRKYLFGLCVAVALFLVMGCALTKWFAGTHYEQFELTAGGQKVMANLPNELPSMENAVMKIESCFNAKVCYQRFCVSVEPGHDHVDFVYIKTDVIALVWTKTAEMEFEKRYIAWVYFGGKPVPAPIDRIREMIKERNPKVDKTISFINELTRI